MYATGAAASGNAVLQALATFAATAGWTVDQSAAAGSGDWIVQMHNTQGVYAQLYSHEAAGANQYTIEICGGTAIASSSTLTNQSPSAFCMLNAGPFTAYHFFGSSSTGAYLHVLVEISSNLFAHMMMGQLNVVGGASPDIYIAASQFNYSGAQASFYEYGYVFGNSFAFHGAGALNTTMVGCTVDSVFRWFQSYTVGTSPGRLFLPMASPAVGAYGSCEDAIVRSPNTFNELAPLLPMHMIAERVSGNVYSWLGDVPDLRVLNIANYNAKDEVTIGSDVWKIFPPIQKSLPWNTSGAPPSSGPYAFAFKKSA